MRMGIGRRTGSAGGRGGRGGNGRRGQRRSRRRVWRERIGHHRRIVAPRHRIGRGVAMRIEPGGARDEGDERAGDEGDGEKGQVADHGESGLNVKKGFR
jgi:hypothetical protein